MILYGAGGHGKVVSTICLDELLFFFDQQNKIELLNGLLVKEYDPMLMPEELLVVTIGNNNIRKRVVQEVSHSFTKVIDKSAVYDKKCRIGEGTQVLHNALIQTGTSIGRHCIINSSASIDHDCSIGDFVHIAPNSTLCGNIKIGDGTFVGAGSTIIPGINIGKWSIIGAGSVVVDDVPDNAVVYGNPAKLIRIRNEA